MHLVQPRPEAAPDGMRNSFEKNRFAAYRLFANHYNKTHFVVKTVYIFLIYARLLQVTVQITP